MFNQTFQHIKPLFDENYEHHQKMVQLFSSKQLDEDIPAEGYSDLIQQEQAPGLSEKMSQRYKQEDEIIQKQSNIIQQQQQENYEQEEQHKSKQSRVLFSNYINQNCAKDSKCDLAAGLALSLQLRRCVNVFLSLSSLKKLKSLRPQHLRFFNDKSLIISHKWNYFRDQDVYTRKQLEHSKEAGSYKHTQKKQLLKIGEHYGGGGLGTGSLKRYSSKLFRQKILKSGEGVYKYLSRIISKIPLFSSSHQLKFAWDCIFTIMVLFNFTFIPYYIVFDSDIVYHVQFLLSIAVLMIDALLQLNQGFYKNGSLITDRKLILSNYLKNRLMSDLLAIIPLILHINIDDRSDKEQIIPVENAILLLFYVKYDCFNTLIRRFKEKYYKKRVIIHLISLISLLAEVLFIAHVFACIWLLTAKYEIINQKDQGKNSNWLYSFNQSFANAGTGSPQQGSVSDSINFVDVGQDGYVISLYFVMVTMITVGYGDVLAVTKLEMLVNIFIMLVACGVFGYSVNQIGTIVQELNSEEKKIDDSIMSINRFMDKRNINGELQSQIRAYLQYYLQESENDQTEEQNKVINMLSEPLRRQLMVESNKIALLDSPIFRNNFSVNVIKDIAQIISEVHCTPGDLIYDLGSVDDNAIYFIQKGSVEILHYLDVSQGEESSFASTVQTVNTNFQAQKGSRISSILWSKPFMLQADQQKFKIQLQEGNSFGELSFFTQQERKERVKSSNFTSLIKIKRQDFINLLARYPEDYEQFCAIRDKIQIYSQIHNLGMKCQACQSIKHQIIHCPLLHSTFNKDKIIFKDTQSENQKRQSRPPSCRKQQRYHILQQLTEIQEKALQFVETNFEYLLEQPFYQANSNLFDTLDEQTLMDNDNDLRDQEDIPAKRVQNNNLEQQMSKEHTPESLTSSTSSPSNIYNASNQPQQLKLTRTTQDLLAGIGYPGGGAGGGGLENKTQIQPNPSIIESDNELEQSKELQQQPQPSYSLLKQPSRNSIVQYEKESSFPTSPSLGVGEEKLKEKPPINLCQEIRRQSQQLKQKFQRINNKRKQTIQQQLKVIQRAQQLQNSSVGGGGAGGGGAGGGGHIQFPAQHLSIQDDAQQQLTNNSNMLLFTIINKQQQNEFDLMKEYVSYFPRNNISYILKKMYVNQQYFQKQNRINTLHSQKKSMNQHQKKQTLRQSKENRNLYSSSEQPNSNNSSSMDSVPNKFTKKPKKIKLYQQNAADDDQISPDNIINSTKRSNKFHIVTQ